jgi:hypothetical protein
VGEAAVFHENLAKNDKNIKFNPNPIGRYYLPDKSNGK